MSRPLAHLSASKQNSRSSLLRNEHQLYILEEVSHNFDQKSASAMAAAAVAQPYPDDPPSFDHSLSTTPAQPLSPRKAFSPVKYRLQDDAQATSSPPGSPADHTVRFNEGLTLAISDMQKGGHASDESGLRRSLRDEGMSTIRRESTYNSSPSALHNDTDFTLNLDERGISDDTIGDLSSISAIPTDTTRFANLRNSPTKTPREAWSPSKQLRNSVIFSTPGANQRPLHLLAGSRNSSSSNEDEEATPRKVNESSDSPTDLLNFTGQSNIVIPPPGSAPRTFRRSPSGRGGFPIKVNATPAHRSQASVDRERATGWSPQKQQTSYFPERSVAATPASKRHSMYGAPTGLGMDLLDFDLEPMATPRSIPTVTPRELETLRSELQSRISGLEATLSGKEAEVMALKRAITDAEVRVGKSSEELRTERSARHEMEHEKTELERRSREMEDVLREVKQNAFVEEREREKLRRQAEEADKRVEEHEVKLLELNASLETLRSDRIRSTPSPQKPGDPATPGVYNDIDLAVKNATESVARELHALYKSKHERKVADLKLSYEKRWIKQVEQLRADVKASQDEVMKLQTEKEATMSGVIPGQSEAMSKMEGQIEELRRWNEEVTAEKKVVEAETAGLKGQVESLTSETGTLRKDLEQERIEKGELVAQIESYLTLKAEEEATLAARAQAQAQLQQPVSPPRSEDGNGRPGSAAANTSPSRFRSSMNGESGGPVGPRTGRPRPMSMLQKPTAGKFSGIPGPGSGLKGPTSNIARGGVYGGRSGGIMENITRMGAGGR